MDYFNSYNTKKESPIHPPTAEYFPIFFGPPLLTVQRINRHGAFPIGARHELSEDKTNLASWFPDFMAIHVSGEVVGFSIGISKTEDRRSWGVQYADIMLILRHVECDVVRGFSIGISPSLARSLAPLPSFACSRVRARLVSAALFQSLFFRVVMLPISFWCIAKIELQEGFWWVFEVASSVSVRSPPPSQLEVSKWALRALEAKMASKVERKEVPAFEDEEPHINEGIAVVPREFSSYNAHQDEFGQQESDYRPSSELELNQQQSRMDEQPHDVVGERIAVVPQGFSSYNAHQDEFGQQEPDYPPRSEKP